MRTQEPPKKAYVHEHFPTWRHHPVRESKLVSSQAQQDTDAPDSEGWSDSQVVVPIPAAESSDSERSTQARPEASGDVMRAAFNVNFDQMQKTNHDLLARGIQLNAELDAAYGDISALRNQNQALKAENEALKARKPSATQFQRKAAADPAPETPATEAVDKAAE